MISDGKPLADLYLQSLDQQLKGLSNRDSALDALEAQIRADRTSIQREREEIEVAGRRYRAFLETVSAPSNASVIPGNHDVSTALSVDATHVTPLDHAPQQPTIGEGEVDVAQISTRVGPKRKAVLESVAELAPITVRDVSELTGVNIEVVRNAVSGDTKLGLLVRDGDKISMTEKGFEFMRRAGILSASQQRREAPAKTEFGGATGG